MAHEIEDEAEVREVLARARTIVVLGAHGNPAKPAHYVPQYLHERGYRVVPVSPHFAGRTMFGETVVARLGEVDAPCDLLDVFRRSEDIPPHVDEILAMRQRPKVVWFQAGIVNDDAARRLIEAGIDVVQDRCTMADHRRFRLPAVGPAP